MGRGSVTTAGRNPVQHVAPDAFGLARTNAAALLRELRKSLLVTDVRLEHPLRYGCIRPARHTAHALVPVIAVRLVRSEITAPAFIRTFRTSAWDGSPGSTDTVLLEVDGTRATRIRIRPGTEASQTVTLRLRRALSASARAIERAARGVGGCN